MSRNQSLSRSKPTARSGAARYVGKIALIAELRRFGIGIQRENIRRAHPSWSRRRVAKELRRWLGFEGYTSEIGGPFTARPPRPL